MSEEAVAPEEAFPPQERVGLQALLRPMGWLSFFRAVPSMIEFFDRKVPAEFWTTDAEEDGTVVAVIACPCEAEPRVPQTKCVECECGRFYLYTGRSIRVGRPDADAVAGSA